MLDALPSDSCQEVDGRGAVQVDGEPPTVPGGWMSRPRE